jgi:CRP-like cAMP-binding protein
MGQIILLIEDNAEMLDNIVDILELAHYDVITASNGKQGVDQAQQKHPDLILCDVMMPELDGYGVLHIIRNDAATAHIPFIFLTAKAERTDFRAGMNLGADDYITKPFDSAELLKVIELRLKQRQTRGETRVHDINAFFSKTRESREFQRLAENRVSRPLKKNEVLFMEGQTPADLFLIEKGRLKTYKLNADGKELITGIHHEGEFLGYSELLEDAPYRESAEALEETRISIIPKADFLALMYSSREVTRRFISMLSNNIRQIEERLLDVAYQSVRQRVAGILLQLEETRYKNESVITLTHKNMSSMVGTAPESFNRTLSDFKEEGLIEVAADGIKILDKPRLQRLLR